MELRGKAFYNFLKSRWLDNHAIAVEAWQIEDKRPLADQELFNQLEKLDIQIDQQAFLLYAEKCDSPEELTQCFTDENHDDKHYGQVYLIVFELWRRLCPKKQTLSIFCDELDHLIEQYDSGEEMHLDLIAEHLLELSKILDTLVDKGSAPDEVYLLVTSFFAHDLESFLYDFILDLINQNYMANASNILDAFYPYVEDKRWFALLLARLLLDTEIDESKIMMDRLFIELQEEPDLDLALEMLRTLIVFDEKTAFQVLLDQVSSWVCTEEDFQHLLTIVRDYFGVLDLEQQEKHLTNLLIDRENHPLDAKFFPTDKAMQNLKSLVSDLSQV